MGFAQILEGKIRKDIEASMSSSSNSQQNVDNSGAKTARKNQESFGQRSEIDTDPAHLAYLMSQLKTAKTSISPLKSSYPKPAPRPRTEHSLTPLQSRALRFFTSHGVDLGSAFTAKELKKGFWTLAKKLHPDHSKGSGAPFIELKSAYRELQTLFKLTKF